MHCAFPVDLKFFISGQEVILMLPGAQNVLPLYSNPYTKQI